MSDFLYSSENKPVGFLSKLIEDIYYQDPPEISEFHGHWGSLAVSRNLYNGFQPYESERHLVVVIGGPVLTFRNNRFLIGDDPVSGTISVYERFIEGTIKWDEDLSGPFVILIVNKYSKKIRCITDLMFFIPVYQYVNKNQVALGTHVDALAKSTGQHNNIDKISLTDFILNSIVTYPYTVYKSIRQCTPAAIHDHYPMSNPIIESTIQVYWEPVEKIDYENINEAARDLRDSVSGYIQQVTDGMDHVALFLSGGEDSRVVAGMLPTRLKKDAFVFLDSMNREGIIARKASKAYDIHLDIRFRKPGHYLNILPEACNLLGSGQQYLHAHTLKFHKECKLAEYDAVFCGYLANALLKGEDFRKNKLQKRISVIYEYITVEEDHSKSLKSDYFQDTVLAEVDERRREHLNVLREFRIESLHQWFHNWPGSMGQASPGYSINRRLFRSYEPFMCNEVVKLAAVTPVSWKLNRRLFHKAMRPYLKPAKWVPHGKGWLPYLSWRSNIPISLYVSIYKRIGRFTGLIRENKLNQGPWGDRGSLMDSMDKEKTLLACEYGMDNLKSVTKDPVDISKLTIMQQLNLFQTLYLLESVAGKVKVDYFHDR